MAILIILLVYGLTKVKFTVGIRMIELQLGVWSSQVSMQVF
jgi:hypothetical protein